MHLSDVYRIWQHLVEIVKGGQVSVIITTHYIEEARQANMVRYTHSWSVNQITSYTGEYEPKAVSV